MIGVERLSSDVAAVLNNREVLARWRGVHLYMGKIRGEIGKVLDVLDACKELLEKQPEYFYDEFKDDWKAGKIDKSYCILAFTPRERVDGYIVDRTPQPLCQTWYRLFPLCRKVWDCIPVEERGEDKCREYMLSGWRGDYNKFPRYALLVSLYWALRNERERIREQAMIEGVALPVVDEAAPVLPPVAVAAPAAVTSPSPGRNAASKEKDGILTASARKQFKEAIEYKYMKKRKGDGYQWLHDGGKVALSFFFKNVYPNNTPWERLGTLFFIDEEAVGNLKGAYEKMKASYYWQARFGSEDGRKRYKGATPPPWFTTLCSFFNL